MAGLQPAQVGLSHVRPAVGARSGDLPERPKILRGHVLATRVGQQLALQYAQGQAKQRFQKLLEPGWIGLAVQRSVVCRKGLQGAELAQADQA